MFHQCCCDAHIIVVRNHLFQDGQVARLADVCTCAGNQPQRVVIEAASDIGVSLFGEGLVLVVRASVLELRRGNINNAFPCALGNQMHETEQVLTGIPKSHSAPDTGLIVGSGAAHVEGDHALVLVPDIDHSVYVFVRRFNSITAKKIFPVII